jgi:hypothetical protein
MAFPDYGPLQSISQFTQDGLAQGAFLFELFAGERNTLALHYIGLLFAMVGAIAIVFMKQFHNIKTIASWTFLVLVLLIGPRNSQVFFTEVPVNNMESGVGTIHAYAPQAVIIDGMSKIHKAIFTGFFDVSDPDNPRMRNSIQDTLQQASGSSKNSVLNERPDIRHEIFVYKAMNCGDPIDLVQPLYNSQWQSDFDDYIKDPHPNLSVTPEHLTIEQTRNLQDKLFKARDIKNLIVSHKKYFEGDTGITYPVFGVLYETTGNLQESLLRSGIDADKVTKIVEHFDYVKGAELLDKITTSPLPFAFTSKANIVDEIGDNITEIFPDSDHLEYPVITGFITDNDATADWGITSFGKIDALEARLDKDVDAYGFLNTKERMQAWSNFVEKSGPKNEKGDVPMMLGFITPSPQTLLYAKRANEKVGDGNDKRDISGLSDNAHLNIVSTCAQLHSMVHNHIADAVLFQNTWPAHGGASYGTDNVNAKARNGFEKLSDSGDGTYRLFPYGTTERDNASPQMKSFEAKVQALASGLVYTDQNADTKTNLMLVESANTRKAAAELVRRALISDIVRTTLKSTHVPVMSNFNINEQFNLKEELTGEKQDDYSKAINHRFEQGPKENIETVTSWLQPVVSWVGGAATWIASEFAGMGALAFIKFLQLFIGISIFFVAMCTPILYMMGVLIPKQAPGVIVTSLITIVALKAIPIGFTLVDAMMTIVMKAMIFGQIEKSLMIYVAATAYTSVTLITFFLLFKAGDTETVMGKMSQLDSKANEIAEQAVSITKNLAIAVAAAATAGIGGAAGGALTAKAAGGGGKAMLLKGLKTGGSQMAEIGGKRGLQAFPGAGSAFGEITNSFREGKGQGTVMQEIEGNNADLDKKIQSVDTQLNQTDGITPEKRESLLKDREGLMSQKKSYSEHITGYKDAQAEQKYRSQTDGAQQRWASQRAEKKFEKSADSQGMTTQEARRSERDARAESAVNNTLGAAVQAKELQVKGDVTLDNVEMSANAARAIQMGQLQADRTYKQANNDASTTQRLAAVQDELKQETKSVLATEVEGQAAKEVKSAVTVYEYNDDGTVKSSRAVPQDPMYDQAGGELKKTLEGTPEFNTASPTTRKNATELTAAKQLAEHSKGAYTDAEGNQQEFKLSLDPQVTEVLEKHGQLESISNSRNAKDLWVDPQSPMYQELRDLKNSDGKSTFGVMEGHSVSLFNNHIQNDDRAKQMAKNIMKDTNQQINAIKRND